MHSPALIERARLIPTAFTRQRHLTLPRVVAMMLSGMCSSVQAEFDSLFAQIEQLPTRARRVSAQAFSQARKGFSWTLFAQANDHLLALAQPMIDAQRWHGLRVLAGDGSRLRVATRAGADLQADHYAFALFLPGTELTVHASLHAADGSQRQMLFEALDVVQPQTDLLVLQWQARSGGHAGRAARCRCHDLRRAAHAHHGAPDTRPHPERYDARADDLVARC